MIEAKVAGCVSYVQVVEAQQGCAKPWDAVPRHLIVTTQMWCDKIKFQLPTSSVSLELHWLQLREKKVSPLSAGAALGERHSRWMFEEHKEHIRDGDEGAECSCSWHRGHVGTGVLCGCINISEKATEVTWMREMMINTGLSILWRLRTRLQVGSVESAPISNVLDCSVDRGSQECEKSKVTESTIHPLLRKSSAVACDDHTSKLWKYCLINCFVFILSVWTTLPIKYFGIVLS